MKKIKTLALALILGAILISCKSVTPEDARKYNDELISIENKLSKMETAYLDIAFTDSTKAQKKAVYDAVVTQANEALATADKMEAFDGNSEYLDAAKAYFKTIKGICDVEYKQAFDLLTVEGRELTDEENAQLDKVATTIDDKSAAAIKNIQTAQTVFAAKYGFTVDATTPAVTN